MNAFHWRGPSTVQIEQPSRGRPRLDITDEERAQRHREAALRWYYKQQARKAPCFFALMGEAHKKEGIGNA